MELCSFDVIVDMLKPRPRSHGAMFVWCDCCYVKAEA